MLRKFVVYLFILTSLSAQASTAFACEMMEQVVERCCCGDEMTAPRQAGDDPCCEQITVVVADEGATADLGKTASKKSSLDFSDLPLLAAALAVLLPDARDASALPPLPRAAIGGSGTLTYLHTLRLRI